MNLKEIRRGEEYEILTVNLNDPLLSRLRSLGLTRGAKVEKIGDSLLKKSILVNLGGVRVGIGKRVAERIEVKPL